MSTSVEITTRKTTLRAKYCNMSCIGVWNPHVSRDCWCLLKMFFPKYIGHHKFYNDTKVNYWIRQSAVSCTARRPLILCSKELETFTFTKLWYRLLLLQRFFPDHMISFPSETNAAVSHSAILQVCNLWIDFEWRWASMAQDFPLSVLSEHNSLLLLDLLLGF